MWGNIECAILRIFQLRYTQCILYSTVDLFRFYLMCTFGSVMYLAQVLVCKIYTTLSKVEKTFLSRETFTVSVSDLIPSAISPRHAFLSCVVIILLILNSWDGLLTAFCNRFREKLLHLPHHFFALVKVTWRTWNWWFPFSRMFLSWQQNHTELKHFPCFCNCLKTDWTQQAPHFSKFPQISKCGKEFSWL